MRDQKTGEETLWSWAEKNSQPPSIAPNNLFELAEAEVSPGASHLPLEEVKQLFDRRERKFLSDYFSVDKTSNSLVELRHDASREHMAAFSVILAAKVLGENEKAVVVVSSTSAMKETLLAAVGILKLRDDEIAIISGDFSPEERRSFFLDNNRKLFIATDKALQNDLADDPRRSNSFRLAVFGDVHEARGNNPFARLAADFGEKGIPIVGLSSATPVSRQKFEDLLETLEVKRNRFYKLSSPHRPVTQSIEEVGLDERSRKALTVLTKGISKAVRQMDEILSNSYKYGYSPERQETARQLKDLVQDSEGNMRIPSQSEAAAFRLVVSGVSRGKKNGGWGQIFSLSCEIAELIELHHCIASHGRHSFLERAAGDMWKKESGTSRAESNSTNYMTRIYAPSGAAREAYKILSRGTGGYERLLTTNIAQLKRNITSRDFLKSATEDLVTSDLPLHQKEQRLIASISKTLDDEPAGRLLVFVGRQEDARALAARVSVATGYTVEALSKESKKAKAAITDRFNDGSTQVLIATSSLFGENVEPVSHVITYSPPDRKVTSQLYKLANQNGAPCKITYFAASGTSEVGRAAKAKRAIDQFERNRFTEV